MTNGNPSTSTKPKLQIEDGGCSHCGGIKHTKDTCYKLHGYPDWWQELKAKKKRDVGRAACTNSGRSSFSHVAEKIEPQLSIIPQEGSETVMANNSSTLTDSGNHGWIIDSGATDYMTFDPRDFIETTQPKRTCIANANGVKFPVTRAGRVTLSPSLSLQNTILVPSLSNRLLSVGQATKKLNCCALIYPKFCLFQDILTKEIIARGTKQEALYFIGDFSVGRANNICRTSDKEREIWLWHRRMGHPSFSYLRHVFLKYEQLGKMATFRRHNVETTINEGTTESPNPSTLAEIQPRQNEQTKGENKQDEEKDELVSEQEQPPLGLISHNHSFKNTLETGRQHLDCNNS
ncbi:hypothetical protein BUALT_Bualt07G0076000 [Buddleja alternifolia]|uniref:GAG-pre-integrase domain-containing protein n=1 Tax=Buddleja alternifolia TaxID=168488 RepID=A0AAV6X8U6_9LAMI|nr:hypothetical protein BUALT_Bualt07G0076000 [Buddleja alternifolia]